MISVDGSRVVARMLTAQENRMIVRNTFATLFPTPDGAFGTAFTSTGHNDRRVASIPV